MSRFDSTRRNLIVASEILGSEEISHQFIFYLLFFCRQKEFLPKEYVKSKGTEKKIFVVCMYGGSWIRASVWSNQRLIKLVFVASLHSTLRNKNKDWLNMSEWSDMSSTKTG